MALNENQIYWWHDPDISLLQSRSYIRHGPGWYQPIITNLDWETENKAYHYHC